MPKKRKRVGILTNRLLDWEPPHEPRFGGGERYCLTLGEFLQREGFDVTFFQAGRAEFEGRYFGFPVRALPIGNFLSEFHFDVCNRFAEATADFDHVVINVPAYASGKVRDDAILICHGIWFDHENWAPPIQFRTPEWFGHLYRAFSQPARVISVDTNSINVIRALWPPVATRMRYVPNWADGNVFRPRRRPAEAGPHTKNRLTVLFPRRAEINRGSRIVESIISRIPHDVRFLWVGDGEPDEIARLRELAEREPRFELKTATFDDMPGIYATADIAVIPTLACEGTSLSCLEALASGCAVVATNVGGLVDLVQDKVNGLLVEPEPASIATAINQLITDRDLRSDLQAAGQRSATRFTREVWEGRWREFLTEVGWIGKAKKAGRGKSAEKVSEIGAGVRLATASAGDSAATRIAYLEGQLSEWDKIFAAQYSTITFLNEEVGHREKRLDFLTTELEALRREVAGKTKSMQFLTDEIAGRDAAIAEHRKGVEFLKAELEQLQNQLRASETESHRIRQTLQATQADYEREKTQTTAQTAAKEAQVNAELRRSQRLIDTIQADLEIREIQLRKLEAHSAQQAEGIEWLRTEVAIREEKLAIREEKLERIYHSRMWRTTDVYWRTRRLVLKVARSLRLGPKEAALKFGRRILPRSLKRYLKRFWDPNERLKPQELALLKTIPTPVVDGSAISLPSTYDVICFSIIDWSFRWQRPQQIMARFAREGHRVFFLSTTEFLPPGEKRFAVTALRENVWELKIAAPFPLDVYGGAMRPDFAEYIAQDLDALRREFNINCAVSFVQVATWAPAAYEARRRFGWKIVYDCMDEWNTFPGMKQPLLAAEQELVKSANLLVVSAQRLVEKWRPDRPDLVLARNAADVDHYSGVQPNDLLADVSHPIVGYFGAIADWFDLSLMLRLAKERPDYSFVLIGGVFNVPVHELQALPNVHILGQKPYELMPSYLLHFDVCIIPFVVNAVTEATDPVKFYEYISMGKPVVAPRMPELFSYRDYLHIAEDHDDFLRKVDEAVGENDPPLRDRRIDLARRNTWAARVKDIKKGIREAHEKVSIIVVTFHNLEYSRLCIDSVLRNTLHPNFELVVVDNASDDDTPEYLEELAARHDNIKIILNERNFGFARANNQGVAASSGAYVVLLNNDTVVPNGWLPKLLAHMRRPDFGLIVTVTNFSGNESRIAVPYTDLNDLEEFAARYTREHEGELFDIRVAAMYCVAMRREVYDKVGPLDEQFSVGMFEDDDYSERMRRAGYRVVCVEDVYIHHFGQVSFRKLTNSEYQAIWERNQQLYEKKWGVTWKPHTLREGVR